MATDYKPGTNPNSLKNLLPKPPAGAARKGAYAANKAKKRKRQMREAVEYLLTLPVQDGSKPQKLKNILEAKTKNLTVIEAMVVAQIKKAVTGDTKAFNALLDIYGKQQVESTNDYEFVSDEEDRLMEALQSRQIQVAIPDNITFEEDELEEQEEDEDHDE